MSAGVVTLPDDDVQARWAILAWLAYPAPRQASLAMLWLTNWGLRRIGDSTTIKPSRLDRNLSALETRFRHRLAVADAMNARLWSARLKTAPWSDAIWENEVNEAHDAAVKQPPRDGGLLPPIAVGPLRIAINNPPSTSRALADYIMRQRNRDSDEQNNVVRSLVTASRPIMALAIASCHLGPGPAYMNGRCSDWDAEDPSTWGLLEAAAFGAWPVAPLIKLAEQTRQDLIALPEMPFSANELIEWRHPDSF